MSSFAACGVIVVCLVVSSARLVSGQTPDGFVGPGLLPAPAGASSSLPTAPERPVDAAGAWPAGVWRAGLVLPSVEAVPPADFAAARAEESSIRRPAPLVPLYVSFAALQALDAHSTRRAIDAGHLEANPLMAGVASHPVALAAVKTATAAGTIYLVERLWPRNRAAALVLMTGVSVATGMVVRHNYSVR